MFGMFNKDEDMDKLEKYFSRTKKDMDILVSDFQNAKETEIEIFHQRIREMFLTFFKSLFDTEDYLTENEILHKLRNFNITRETLKKLEMIILKLMEVEYNQKAFDKEHIYSILEQFMIIVDELYIHEKERIIMKKKRLFKQKKETILKSFEKNFIQLKSDYSKNLEINKDIVVKVKAYFDMLPLTQKEKFSKEVHYYCEKIPEITELILFAEKIKNKDQMELHQAIIKINHLFVKLNSDEKKEMYPKILSVLNSDEEKLNLYIMMAYDFFYQKKIKEAKLFYPKIVACYNTLSNDKKRYYHGVIGRLIKKLESQMVQVQK